MPSNYPNMQDVARRLDPNGKIDKVVELLAQTNEVLDDLYMTEGNLPVGHKTTVRSGLPSATWRLLNYGVQPSKSRTKQIVDNCGMLEAYAEIDKELADLNGNTAQFRLDEDRAFLEAMNQEMVRTLFYGDMSKPEQFVGLTPRYNDASADSAENIINGGGTGSDNTSIWLVVWGANTIHGIYPKGSKAGFMHENLGQQTLTDADGGRYEGYRSHYQWKTGLTVRDWRYAVRIANIDVSNLTSEVNAADLVKLMIKATHKIPNQSMGRAAFYCNKTVATMLDLQTLSKSNLNLGYADIYGKPVLNFRGNPIRRVDQILNTEAAVSGL